MKEVQGLVTGRGTDIKSASVTIHLPQLSTPTPKDLRCLVVFNTQIVYAQRKAYKNRLQGMLTMHVLSVDG